jgi:RNA-directed DNA polymerase
MVGHHRSWISEEQLVGEVSRMLRGWTNYFSYGTLRKTYSRLEVFTQQRIRGWLVHKHRVGDRGECRFPAKHIYGPLGLVKLAQVLTDSRTP